MLLNVLFFLQQKEIRAEVIKMLQMEAGYLTGAVRNLQVW